MQQYRRIIQRIIDEHKKIKEHLRLIGDTMSDREAMAGLENARSSLTPGQVDDLARTQESLLRVFSVLDEGLRNHFALEEGSLLPLLGEILMTALELEHQDVKKKTETTKTIINI